MLAALRLSLRELRLYGSDGQPVPLERKAFDVLACLVAERERVVSKDDLLVSVWGRDIASDSVIAQAVSKARRALAAGGGDPAWIDVVRGTGYRYIGPVEPVLPVEAEHAAAVTPTSLSRRRWGRLAGAALLLLAGIGMGMIWQQREAARDPLRIAVLPWRNDSGDNGLDWARRGLQGLVADAIASDRHIEPLSPASIRSLLDARPDLTDTRAQAEYLGSAAGASQVFAGRLLRADDGLQVELVVLGNGASNTIHLAGEHPATLALAATAHATRHLLPDNGTSHSAPLSSIAFANEAHARGVDARLGGDAETARHHLQAAIAADPQLLASRYQLSLALQVLRRNDEWRATLDELAQLARARGDRLYEGQALVGQGILAWREGRLDDAQALITSAAALFNGDNDGLRRAAVEGNLGSLAALRGNFDDAEAALRRSLSAFEQAGQQAEIARVSKNLGILALDRGRHDEAAAWITRSLEIRQALGQEHDLAQSLAAMASIDMARDRPVAAQASYARAAAIFELHRDPLLESDTLARLGNALVAQGRLTDAQAAISRSLAAARSADNAAALCLAHLKLTWIARLRGDPDGARRDLDDAARSCHAANDHRGLIRVDLERAQLAAMHGDPDAALAAVAAALAAAGEQGDRALEAEALLIQASLPDSAAQSVPTGLDRALALARELNDVELLARAQCARIGVADGVGDGDEAVQALADCERAGKRTHAAAAMARHALVRHALARNDRERATYWLRQQRDLAGEFWRPDDEALWRDLVGTSSTGPARH
ncbi:tetratricopeptide repeat protein [Dokdonella sp.]|uniref:tetratricopeptide repeat protein n=1 Tax=Dokdonella sp. TaxID=2291710 RepID=UPI0025C42E75|nr:tetratricopeptide repeat protein [Dokdonella sp.]MBX3693362.1 tetratricopeptide repeat protein [Dokdonella sp.]MCW5567190.1 tetratricopeptide repeat protein [Dokdonella sp.]